MLKEQFEKEMQADDAQFSLCQAEKSATKQAMLENQQDIKVHHSFSTYNVLLFLMVSRSSINQNVVMVQILCGENCYTFERRISLA